MLQEVSIIIEAVIAVIFMSIALKKKKTYGYAFALTFLIYTMYDAAKLLAVEIDSNTLSIAFLLATVSAGLGAWKLYKSK